MFEIATTRAKLFFCLSITLFGIVGATGLEFVFYPEEFVSTAPGKKAFIVSAIALPASWVIAGILHRNLMLNRELTRLVNRDRLTDVATRDFFFARLAMDNAAYGVSLMIDIDKFKSVNDTFGHLVGDKVIARVALTLGQQLREEDILCRFGGEEFLAFLEHATPDEGWAIADRIRLAVQEDAIASDAGLIKVTVSVGGSLKAKLDEIEETIRRADLCLYRAKALGRNRTIVDWQGEGSGLHPNAAGIPVSARRKTDAQAIAS